MVSATITLLVLWLFMSVAYVWYLRRRVADLNRQVTNAKLARNVSHSDYIGQLDRIGNIKGEIKGAIDLLKKAQTL